MHKRILITGGAGFVGSSLAISFRQAYPDAQITAFDNLKRRGSELNLARLKEAGVTFVHGDVRVAEDLEGLPDRPDLILECSAEPSVQAGYHGSPEYLVQTNLTGCFRCLELARKTGADFIFLSTSRVYPIATLNRLAFVEEATRFSLAEHQDVPGASSLGIGEALPLDGARSLYGMTKLAAELMVAEYGDAYGLRTVVDRCGLLAGPWQMAKSDQGVVTLWVAAHVFGTPLRYIGFGGTGKQVRDVLHVDDLATLLIEQAAHLDRYNGQTFNVGGGLAGSVSLSELTAICEEVTGRRLGITGASEDRRADIKSYVTDHRKVTALGSWVPRHAPASVVRDIARWLEQSGQDVRRVLQLG